MYRFKKSEIRQQRSRENVESDVVDWFYGGVRRAGVFLVESVLCRPELHRIQHKLLPWNVCRSQVVFDDSGVACREPDREDIGGLLV